MSSTCGPPCPVIRAEKQVGELSTCTGQEDYQLPWDERKLLSLEINLKELIPGYTDGVTRELIPGYTDGVAQEDLIKKGDFHQEDNQEQRRSTAAQAAKGQQKEPIPVNPGEHFQNHALRHGHTLACTRQIMRRRWKLRARVSRLSGRGGFRRIVRQGGSSNPKGGTGQEDWGQETQDVRSSGRRGLERPPIRRKLVQGISG
jgi:hypothetical protein